MKKLWSLILALALMLTCCAGIAEEVITEIPREEAMYMNGQCWGIPTNYNVFALSNTGWPVGGGERMLVYEDLYMFNMLTNENEPLIAESAPVWEDEFNFTVKIKENVHFQDGEALTADDVVYTFNIANEANGGYYTTWSSVWTYLEKVEKVDEYTVRFTIPAEPYNKLYVPAQLAFISIIPQHTSEKLFAECENDIAKVREHFGIVNGTGAYKPYFWDETRVVAIRDDAYWGQAENMFGKLSEVKYIVHPIFVDNAAGNLAMEQGMIDIAQQFTTNQKGLHEIVDENGTPLYKTWLDEAPYQLGAGSPSLIFNLQADAEGLNDPIVHKAIALALDYEAIAQNAMDGQTKALVPCFLNPDLYDKYIDWDNEDLQNLMWDTTAVDDNLALANKMLHDAGYIDTDNDGIRELPSGAKHEWKAECPTGWSDWNASLEILCESAKKIGLNIVTYFPESSVYNVDLQTGKFDIIMNSPYGALNTAQPWNSFYSVMYRGDVPEIGTEATHNYNRYGNEEMDALINELAATDDLEIQKEIVTELIIQWLKDMPTVQLMYRPAYFHTSYEGVWKGMPSEATTGTAIPPTVNELNAGIKALYNLTPAK